MPDLSTTRAYEFLITGLHCGGCVANSERALRAVPGVLEAKVQLEGGKAEVHLSPEFTDVAALDAAIREAGYKTDIEARLLGIAELQRATEDACPMPEPSPTQEPLVQVAQPTAPTDLHYRLLIEGMTCASCVSKVQNALAAVSGASSAEVNFATHRATVHASAPIDTSLLVQAVRGAGYDAQVIIEDESQDPMRAHEEERARAEAEIALWRTRFIGAAIGSAILMAWSPLHLPIVGALAVASAVQFGAGLGFYRGAWRALRARTNNMDTLIALSTTAAYANGIRLMLQGGEHAAHSAAHDFMTGAMLLAFISLGKWLEGRGRSKAGDALRGLLELAPGNAHVMEASGETRDIPARELQPGQRCRVLQGERVPADGKLESAAAELDEAMLTGEPIPATKKIGDTISGGTVNSGPAFTMLIERTGAATTLRQIARRVEEAQNTRPRIQAMADQVSSIFVPVVMVIAALAGAAAMAWGLGFDAALDRAIAVLIVACPCALGLATPLAVMAGVGVAARRGIIVRSAEALERSREITMLAFDKTGTLTEGRPEVTGLFPTSGHDEAGLLSAAAMLEGESTHPLATAILASARARGIPIRKPKNLHNVIGSGVRSEQPELALGSAEFLRELNVRFTDLPAEATKRQSRGETVIAVGEPGGELIGAITLADAIKPGAARAVEELTAMGIKTAMISGDSEATTRAVAQLLRIGDFSARTAPAAKADAIKRWQTRGEKVAMAGDGINDAPALAQAELGIAMAGGSDIAQQAAGMVLLSGDPRQVVSAIRLARTVRAKMIQNLAWAFVYNLALIPLAAFGMLQPIYASAAMAASSVTVVFNALLLYRVKK